MVARTNSLSSSSKITSPAHKIKFLSYLTLTVESIKVTYAFLSEVKRMHIETFEEGPKAL